MEIEEKRESIGGGVTRKTWGKGEGGSQANCLVLVNGFVLVQTYDIPTRG